ALAARPGEPVILLGDGAAAIRSPHARPAPPSHRAPSPVWVALLGVERLRAGETVAPADLVPLYLRPSEAELKRRAVAGRRRDAPRGPRRGPHDRARVVLDAVVARRVRLRDAAEPGRALLGRARGR